MTYVVCEKESLEERNGTKLIDITIYEDLINAQSETTRTVDKKSNVRKFERTEGKVELDKMHVVVIQGMKFLDCYEAIQPIFEGEGDFVDVFRIAVDEHRGK